MMNHEFPCGRVAKLPLTRRAMLGRVAGGFGQLALAGLLADTALGHAVVKSSDGTSNVQQTHFPAKAKHVIYLYMDGGPSQVDTFDPKPRLTQDNGKPFAMKMEPTQFNNNGNTLGSPWEFKQHGESGIPVSSLLPNIAKHVDSMAVVRSLVSNFNEHTNANYFLHTGLGIQGRPSMGAWFAYGLGTECKELPAFVVLNGGLIPPGGMDCFGSSFLPATFQGSIFGASSSPIANVERMEKTEAKQLAKLSLLKQLDQSMLERTKNADPIESAIRNYELAFKMQVAVPEIADLSTETAETQRMYGIDSQNPATAIYARQCLLARRLVERGVRFIEVTCPSVGHDRWDQHANLKKGHEDNSMATDQPIGALLTDLKQRGLFDETLIVWSGEFGRTPFAQGSDGRDHNPYGFSAWLAGGGIKGGTVYGATDEFGYKAVENRVEIHDLHATMLHLMGIDHERLTFRFSGRDMRLTDVHGNVVKAILS